MTSRRRASSDRPSRPDADDPPPWGPPEQVALRKTLAEAPPTTFDLVVVGAGITGAGIARDAALRGLSVLVLEAHDVAFGTSSRSTRLIHGGVRYLEQGELGLVFEALRERSLLYELAPHLTRRARFLFPSYRGDRLSPWKLRLGLTLYDALDFHRGEGHTYLSPEACTSTEPLLASQGLRGAVAYEDAVTDDARLTLTVLQDARRHGAEVLTYAPVTAIERRDDGAFVVAAGDGSPDPSPDLSPDLSPDRLQIIARQVVVATGPWTDATLMGRAGEHLLAKSKGIHLVLRSRDVPVQQPVVVQAPGQRRILFVIPWGTRTYVGTTDDPFEGDPGDSGVTADDERNLLAVVGRLMPGANLQPSAVVSAWSGVRPLVRELDGGATEELSRRHRVVRRADGVLAIVGGKLTTYRAMAEDAVDRVVEGLKRQCRPCTTHERPLVPGAALSGAQLCDPAIADLAPRHGPDAVRLAAQPGGAGARMVADLPYRWAEVDEAIAREGCRHIDDILRRRIPLALTDPDLGGRVARKVAERLVDAWGGSQADIDHELERFCEITRQETRRVPVLANTARRDPAA
ncbi:MAG: glycerol-3-phosphate dehydrogenase/oxidase [Myxococcota bacterium]